MKNEIVWGEETYAKRDDVAKAIEAHCVHHLCNGDCGSVKIGNREYAIAIRATLVESFDPADFRVVIVEVAGVPSDKADADVPGAYEIGVPDSFGNARAASCALDVFHSKVPVEVLDDFTYTVKYNGKILKPGKRRAYADSKAGCFMGRL